jgi:hypothetical protein
MLISYITIVIISQHQISKQMGFSYATPWTSKGEIFIITDVVPCLSMDNAGLKEKDRIIMTAIDDLHMKIYWNQGNIIYIPIKRANVFMIFQVNVPLLKSTNALYLYKMLNEF